MIELHEQVSLILLEIIDMAFRRIYESRGFSVWGAELLTMSGDGQFHDELHIDKKENVLKSAVRSILPNFAKKRSSNDFLRLLLYKTHLTKRDEKA